MKQITYNIIINLQKKENHIRQIAKDIGINHMTTKRALDLLTKQNILNIRKQGKNHVYSLKRTIETINAIKIAEYHKLTEFLKKHPELRKDIEELSKTSSNLIVIFGSYAKNTQTRLSDIDLYSETRITHKRFSIKSGPFKKGPLANEIIKDHIIIKGVDRFYEILEKIGKASSK